MKFCYTCKIQPRIKNQSRCRDCYNDYMRIYLAERYARKRLEAIQLLGGKCAVCGTTESLEFDHIDRMQKTLNIAKIILSTQAKLISELDKCQLLCGSCHARKTSVDMGVPHGGGAKGKRDCPCSLCRDARRAYVRQRRLDKRAKIG